MLRVGLTGGMASGKSYVGRLLAEMGCHLLEADKVAHGLIEPGGAAHAAVVAEFGAGIVREDGSIDRRRLGGIVFADPARLKILNGIVHPLVFAEQERWFAGVAAGEGAEAIAIVEAAIMVETGSHRRYDKLIVAYCRPEQQIARAVARGGLSEEEARQRLARQMPLAEKLPFADYRIDTSGTLAGTDAQVRILYQALASAAQERAK